MIIQRVITVLSVCLLTSAAFAQNANESLTHTDADLYAKAQRKFALRDSAGAAELYRQIVRQNPYADRAWLNLGQALYDLKQYNEAIAAYEKALERGASSPGLTTYNIACCYALLGKKADALVWLEKALTKGFPQLDHVRTDDDLKSLHNDPKFREMAGMADTAKMSREEGWRYDLKLLAREVKRVHYNPFTKVSREEFDRAVKRLHGEIPRLNDSQIIVGFMKLLKLAGDGHTQIGSTPKPRLVPAQFYLFQEGLFITAAAPPYASLVGAEVMKVGKSSVADVMQAMEPIISRDNEEWIKLIAPSYLRFSQVLHGLGLIPTAERVPLTVRDAQGKMQEVVLETTAESAPGHDWALARPNVEEKTPLYLKKRQAPYWFEYLPEAKTVFFQYNMVRDDPAEPLTKFCERLFKFIADNPVERLVIDMRWNGGGNNFLNRPITHGLIRCDKINQRGKLFVIVGRNTFSAAMCGATEIQRHTNALFAGEPTGSRPNFVGETGIQTLPYSKIRISLSFLYWQNSVAMDYRQAIVPEIYAPPTFADYRSGKDAALNAILEGAKEVSRSPNRRAF